jgi:integrase
MRLNGFQPPKISNFDCDRKWERFGIQESYALLRGMRGAGHTHATLLGEVGESLRTAQAILAHSDLKTTLNIYTHAIPESQRRAVAKVAGLVFPSVPEFSAGTENGKVN